MSMPLLFCSLTEKDEVSQEEAASTESPARSSLVPRFTKADSYEDENEIPDLCYTNYDTIQAIQGKIFVFEEEVSRT